MAKIKIREFGPIRQGFVENDGYLDIREVTVFIGDQGSGKSTVAKLISTFTWIEKALVRGDYDKKWFVRKNKLRNQYLSYHRLENYFRERGGKDLTEIDYQGEAYRIHYVEGELHIEERSTAGYALPQIMYVPAERNFIANVKNPKALKMTSDALIEFVTEFDNAKESINGGVALPINGTTVEYDKLNDIVNVRGKDFKLRLTESSSGFQSLVPLYLVSRHLAHTVNAQSTYLREAMSSEELERFRRGVASIWADQGLTEEQRRAALQVLSSKFNKSAFINIVEEPEQNLFPTSQWEMLKSLLDYNSTNASNKLVMTTHSPYMIAYLSLCIQAGELYKKVKDNHSIVDAVTSIVPGPALLGTGQVGFYQLDKEGAIVRIPDLEGVPSDNNYLNRSLREANVLFDQLLEIEQSL